MALFGRKADVDVAALLAAGDIAALRKLTTSTMGTSRRQSKVGPISEQLTRADITPLLDAMKSPDANLRGLATDVLGHAKVPPAADALIAALREDPDDGVRERAARCLGYLTDPRAIEPLIAALFDPGAEVRVKAALSLASVGDERAIAPLQNALGDAKGTVGAAARHGLEGIERRLGDRVAPAVSPAAATASAKRAYLILLWDSRPWADAETQAVVSGKREELGCPVELLKTVRVEGPFPIGPDEFVVSTALLASHERGIPFDADRDRISFSGGEFRPGEGAALITIEIDA